MSASSLSVVHTRVFALTPAGGNPCPVVFGGDGLTAGQMQGLAARFGQETAFVLPPMLPGADARLRYFVPRHEMEMCLHATVGAVTILVRRPTLLGRRLSPSGGATIETPLGPVDVAWRSLGDDLPVTVEQFPPAFHTDDPAPAEVARALAIPEVAIDLGVGPVQSVSTARPKLMVPLVDEATLDGLQPDFERLWGLCDRYGTTGFYPFTLGPERTAATEPVVAARQFPNRAGYNEDAATGVAACALGAYLTRHVIFGRVADGWHAYRVLQGQALGCPSAIDTACLVEGGEIARTRVTGQARIVGYEVILGDDPEVPCP